MCGENWRLLARGEWSEKRKKNYFVALGTECQTKLEYRIYFPMKAKSFCSDVIWRLFYAPMVLVLIAIEFIQVWIVSLGFRFDKFLLLFWTSKPTLRISLYIRLFPSAQQSLFMHEIKCGHIISNIWHNRCIRNSTKINYSLQTWDQLLWSTQGAALVLGLIPETPTGFILPSQFLSLDNCQSARQLFWVFEEFLQRHM